MAKTEAQKTAELEQALARLERQAQQTNKSLAQVLDLPEAKKSVEQVDQVTKALEKQLQVRTQQISQLEDLIEEETRLAAAGKDNSEVAERRIKQQRSLQRSNLELAKTLSTNSDIADKFSDVIDRLNAGLPVTAEEIAKCNKEVGELNKSMQAGDELAEGLMDSIVGLESSGLKKFVGSLQGGKAGLKGFSENLLDTSKMGQRLGSGLLKLAELSVKFALEQDKVFAEFRKSTGAGNEFNQMIKAGEEAGRSYGVTLQESAAQVGALKNTFTEFTYLAPNVQKDIMDTSLVLGEMGLDAQTSADFFQMSMTSLGMGAKEAQQALLDMSATAQGLGVDINKMGQDFIANRDILSRYGANAVDTFKDMAVQAKATGIEVGTLLGFVDQFKTFDQAGQSVGRLNAIMGGPFLNSIDMLNAAMEDPVEGIRMMKSAIDQAGISAEDLSGAEIMAFADALGMSAEDTRKMLSESSEELDQRTMKQEEAAEQAMKMQNINEKLANAFKQLYLDAEPFLTKVIIPLVDKFAALMKWLGDAKSSMGQFGKTALFAGAALGGILMMIPGLQPFAIAGLAILGGLGAAALTAGASEQEGNLSKPTSLKGYSVGGRHIAGQAMQPRSTSVAVVGEGGPELAELGTAGQISTASTTERLTKAMENVSSDLRKLPTGGEKGDTHLAVSIAGEKIEELVIKSLRSPRARNMLGPYAGA
jgi:hypothetical protein